jgi:RimJ/RimL family protein N-acetyltransferase
VSGATIATPRLYLRELTRGDLEAVAAMVGHPEVMRYWFEVYTREDSRAWISAQRERYARDGHGYWLVVERASGGAVGQVGLLTLDLDGSAEVCLGYITHYPYWRRGFATEASGACLRYAFENLGVPRVLAPIRPENRPSHALALKLGMSFDGWTTERTGLLHEVYGISRFAWIGQGSG